MPDKTTDTRTIILTPLAQLLKSRKALTAIAAALINLAILFAPGLEQYRAELVVIFGGLVTVLATVLINAIGKEDAAEKSAPTTIITGSGDVKVTPTPDTTSSPENFGAAFPPPHIPPGVN